MSLSELKIESFGTREERLRDRRDFWNVENSVELQRSEFKNKTVMSSKSESLMSLITSCESDPR